VGLGFQYSSPPFLPMSGHCIPIYNFRYLHIVFNLTNPSYPWYSSIFIPSILALTICFGILSLFFLSICLYHVSLRDFVNITMLAPWNVSLPPYLSLFSSFILVLCDHKFVLKSSLRILFKSTNFFWGHCPGFCPIAWDMSY
jgi:hypothetical protein